MENAFDPAKRQARLEERGLDMADAAEVFETEIRMAVLVWTQRGSTRRIISMRKANDREQKLQS